MDHRLLEILVCPICKGPLRHERIDRTAAPSGAEAELICPADRLAFPVADGIPRMLVDDARRLDDAEVGA
ncbi:MAG: Trm112 family protein [Betaproteobacteria bacterium]